VTNDVSDHAMLLCGNGLFYGPEANSGVAWDKRTAATVDQDGAIIGVHVDMDEKIVKFDFRQEKEVFTRDIPYAGVKMTIEWFYEGQRATVLQVDSVVYERWYVPSDMLMNEW
jgi:hypothetical protein